MNIDKLKNIEKDRMLPKSKTRLVVQRERVRLGMCDLRQRRRVEELPEQRETRPAAERESKKRRRVEESQEQRENRLAASRDNAKRNRDEESKEQRENYRMAFRYSPVDDYSRCVQIGTMSKICPYWKALKFNGETIGMCCASGKTERI